MEKPALGKERKMVSGFRAGVRAKPPMTQPGLIALRGWGSSVFQSSEGFLASAIAVQDTTP